MNKLIKIFIHTLNTGKVHPHLSHNATPFLPRSKKQRLGGGDQIHECGNKESSTKPNKAVATIMNKHLEKEDQEIASKWRDGTKEKDCDGKLV